MDGYPLLKFVSFLLSIATLPSDGHTIRCLKTLWDLPPLNHAPLHSWCVSVFQVTINCCKTLPSLKLRVSLFHLENLSLWNRLLSQLLKTYRGQVSWSFLSNLNIWMDFCFLFKIDPWCLWKGTSSCLRGVASHRTVVQWPWPPYGSTLKAGSAKISFHLQWVVGSDFLYSCKCIVRSCWVTGNTGTNG